LDYIKSLIKILFSKNNFGFLAFMTINIAPFCFIFAYYSVLYALLIFIILFAVYFFFVMMVGELIARYMLKANTRVTLNQRTILSVAFSNAYTAAKMKNPIISNNIRLYVFEDVIIDGYAFGRNTLCLSSAALNLTEQDLTTLLMMKFAQFSHHDSEILAILTAGNIWYVVSTIIFKWYIYIVGFIIWVVLAGFGHGRSLSEGFTMGKILKAIAEFTEKMIIIMVKAIMMLGIGSYKNNIYENDVFVCDCGYKNGLIRFLRDFEPEQIGQETLFGTINSMKPDKHLRLSRIQNYNPTLPSNPTGFRIIRRQ